MKDNNYDFLDELTELDDESIAELSGICPVLDESRKTKICRLCEEKMTMKDNNINKTEFTPADVVNEPVERITRTKWYRSPALTIAASLVLAAGIGATTLFGLSGGVSNGPGADLDGAGYADPDEEATEPEEEATEADPGDESDCEEPDIIVPHVDPETVPDIVFAQMIETDRTPYYDVTVNFMDKEGKYYTCDYTDLERKDADFDVIDHEFFTGLIEGYKNGDLVMGVIENVYCDPAELAEQYNRVCTFAAKNDYDMIFDGSAGYDDTILFTYAFYTHNGNTEMQLIHAVTDTGIDVESNNDTANEVYRWFHEAIRPKQ